jgi:hypothetical protein
MSDVLLDAPGMIITQPDHVILAIPYLLGFAPRNSMVLVWIRDGSIVLTQRYDLGESVSHEVLQQAADHVGATGVVVSAFVEDEPSENHRQRVRDLVSGLSHVIDAIVVHKDRWISALCRESCCPAEGRIIDDSAADEIAVHFIHDGVRVQPSRQSLSEEISPNAAMVKAVEEFLAAHDNSRIDVANPGDAIEAIHDMWRLHVRQEVTTASIQDCIAHISALKDDRVRDGLLWHLSQFPPSELRSLGDYLNHVLQGCPETDIPPLATLSAITRWLAGDGARAWVNLDRVLSVDPDYALANLASTALSTGLPPDQWRKMLSQIDLDTRIGMS